MGCRLRPPYPPPVGAGKVPGVCSTSGCLGLCKPLLPFVWLRQDLGTFLPKVLRLMEDVDREGTGHIGLQDFTDIMSDKIADRDPRDEMIKAFQLFDDDNSGKISLKNLRRVARELGETMNDEELQAMIDEFDKDQDGEINEDEFIAIMTNNDDI